MQAGGDENRIRRVPPHDTNGFHSTPASRTAFALPGPTCSDSDEDEQEKLENLPEIKTQSDQEIINELQSLTPQTPVQVTFRGKSYKRDNKTIAQIKKLRGKKCQICGHYILLKDGGKYVEAAHITAKSEKGVERPHNILILCPNHHKEFDKGDRKIIEHTNDKIIFELKRSL